MARIPAIWRVGITLAVLTDMAALIATVNVHRWPVDHSPEIVLGMTPWGILLALWLLCWTWRGFFSKRDRA